MKITLQPEVTNYSYVGYRPDGPCGTNFLPEYHRDISSINLTYCLQKIAKKIFKRYYFPPHLNIKIIPVCPSQYILQFSGHNILIKQGIIIYEESPWS